MSSEISHRLKTSYEAGYSSCAAMSLASILPGDISNDTDLLALAEHNDGSMAWIAELVEIGLYRHGYVPLIEKIEPNEDVMAYIAAAESKRIRNIHPDIVFFGALVLSSQYYASEEMHNAIETFALNGGQALQDMRRNDFAYVSGVAQVENHVFAIPAVYRSKGRKKFGYVDTALHMDPNKPVPYKRIDARRAERRFIPPMDNIFFDEHKGVICHGVSIANYKRGSSLSQTEKEMTLAYLEERSQYVRDGVYHMGI